MLKQCIRSIESSNLEFNEIEIIVVDNDSHDGSVKSIEQNFPNVKIITNINNEGFSKAVNKGLKLASGRYLCLMNPDVIISKDTFITLITYLDENKNVGCVGPKILNVNGTIQHSCKRSFPTPLNAMSRLLYLDRIFLLDHLFHL